MSVTAKPIQISALQTFDPERYGKLSWGGKPRQIDATEPGWNPFMQLDECEEGLAWDVIAQVSAWLHSPSSPARAGPPPERQPCAFLGKRAEA
ncbi:alpha/beta hydrolase domain-containing protein [Aerococcus mictus]